MDMDDSSLTAWLAAARAIHFTSCLLIAGVWAFDRIVVRGEIPAWRRWALAILLVATPVALVSGAAWFVLVTANMSDLTVGETICNHAALGLVWSQTHFGRTWQIHFGLWAAAALSVGMYAVFRRGQWAGLLLSCALVAGLAWAGHGSTGPAPGWHLFCDLMHLLAVCLWPTGLVPLALLLVSMSRSADLDRQVEIYRIVRRFSACSLMAVGLLTITGLFNSWCLVGSLHALFSTSYGRILVAKLILFTIMIGFGAVNLLVLKPRILSSDVALRRLRINVMIEILLGSGVVAAVGLLGLLEPPGPMKMTTSAVSVNPAGCMHDCGCQRTG